MSRFFSVRIVSCVSKAGSLGRPKRNNCACSRGRSNLSMLCPVRIVSGWVRTWVMCTSQSRYSSRVPNGATSVRRLSCLSCPPSLRMTDRLVSTAVGLSYQNQRGLDSKSKSSTCRGEPCGNSMSSVRALLMSVPDNQGRTLGQVRCGVAVEGLSSLVVELGHGLDSPLRHHRPDLRVGSQCVPQAGTTRALLDELLDEDFPVVSHSWPPFLPSGLDWQQRTHAGWPRRCGRG